MAALATGYAVRLPECVAPAGNLEKCMIAFAFGADAVYVGCSEFSLRKSAENFTFDELKIAVSKANALNKRIFVTLNGMPHNEDLPQLIPTLKKLEALQPHAFIISDLGVMRLAKKWTNIPLHTSTQASVCNWRSARLWKEAGAKRVVVARELSIKEAAYIQEKAKIEVEIFIHGAMCSSYSGKCTISNYTSGRDSNRGGCIQSCRHAFQLEGPKNSVFETPIYIMNAKDLMAIRLLPEIIESGISALKIEGRMKSNLYLANTLTHYKKAMTQKPNALKPAPYEKALSKVSNRGFSTGSLEKRAAKHDLSYQWKGYQKQQLFIGTLKQVNETHAYCLLKNPVSHGDTLTVLAPNGSFHPITIQDFWNTNGSLITKSPANRLIKLPKQTFMQAYSILVKEINE